MVNLRGRRNPLGDRDDRVRLAELLREQQVESLIVDPFGRAYCGANQNDSGEVGAWLTDLDRFARSEAGAMDLILTTHAGWNGERARGSSALEDWADSVVTMTRGDGKDEDTRYVRAIGRDVLVEEDQLDFDPRTRLLTLTGRGSRTKTRKNAKTESLQGAVVDYVTAHPGSSVQDIIDGLRDLANAGNLNVQFQDADVRAAAKSAAEQRLLLRNEGGPGKPTRHYPVSPSTADAGVHSPCRVAAHVDNADGRLR
jgi:hypothetical protein